MTDQFDDLLDVATLDSADRFLDHLVAVVGRDGPVTTTQIVCALVGATHFHWEPDPESPNRGSLIDLANSLIDPNQLSPDDGLELFGAYVVLLANAIQRVVSQPTERAS